MSYSYSQYVANLANMLSIDPTNANYLQQLPTFIDDAEQRIYRELDLMNTIVRDATGTLTANSRNFTLPQSLGRFVITESMNIFTPVGTTTNRIQLIPTTREVIDGFSGNESASTSPSVPTHYAPITDQQFLVGWPSADANYTMEVVGTIRPTPLSASNTQTYLTLYLPDLFFTASLIFGYGYMKDYGAATDDPSAPGSWEAHYKIEAASANTEEQRKRYASQGWTPKQPAPLATPPRA